jgi:hypothetical protein
MSPTRVSLAAIALTLTAAAGAAAQDSGLGAGTPESRYFRVDSAVAAGRHGLQVQGYVYNVYDAHAQRVQLRVEELDATGRVLETRTVLVPLDVPARGRAFFAAPAPAGTASARVSVLSFEWSPRGGGGGGM